ncbi:MAG: DUF4410 domain-containing protein [Alphaproteobacteria bacterium]|nr:MAG: DUF4410 domain-containing protein [Alphaproteobacteria bacterium]
MFMRRVLGLGLVATALVACGSTSDLSAVNNGINNNVAGTQQPLSFAQYDRVVVREFANKTGDESEATNLGVNKFGMYIASNLKSNTSFKEVIMEAKGQNVPLTTSTLIVDGAVTRYTEGNKALRLLVGMGAGSSYFDADVNVRDATSGATIAQSKVDLNSWGLGGSIAMSQTVDSFMMSAASEVASDVVTAKQKSIQPADGMMQAVK